MYSVSCTTSRLLSIIKVQRDYTIQLEVVFTLFLILSSIIACGKTTVLNCSFLHTQRFYQKELKTESCRTRRIFLALRRKKKNKTNKKTPPKTQKNQKPAPQKLLTIYSSTQITFPTPIFTNMFLLCPSEILYSVIFVMTSLSKGSLYVSM